MDYINDDFMLHGATAHRLYHEYAEHQPILDYHCHLSPKEVAEDRHFRSITELWLGGDHYKWRAMRANGIPEELITGNGSDWEKFKAWADTLAHAFRNPLYVWSHLELKTAFGITTPLNPDTARDIYDQCNEIIQQPQFSARALMRHYNVEAVCTTDDPVDDLHWHEMYASEKTDNKMLPAWRPDKAVDIEKGISFADYIHRLAEVSDSSISSFTDLVEALQKRHDFFAKHGCRLSDHGIDRFYADDYTEQDLNTALQKALNGERLTQEEISKYKSALLYELAVMDANAGWVQQFHYGPLRNNCTRLFQKLGPDIGCDSMDDVSTAVSMSRFFDRLDLAGKLTKTIVYNLNPRDNAMVATMVANFQDGSTPGKMQWGSAWWFMDQKDGMEAQLNMLSNQGLLSRFVGMLTDSRSFLSYPRHEYFRRVLCNLIGNDVDNSLLPITELPRLGQMVADICYGNAKRYFLF